MEVNVTVIKSTEYAVMTSLFRMEVNVTVIKEHWNIQ